MMLLFIKLLLAHLAGDFLLQPDKWVKAKEEKKLRCPQLYLHALLHGVLPFLLVWKAAFWLAALLIACSHFIIDAAKILLQKTHNRRQWFLLDQLLHIAVLVTIWIWWERPFTSFTFLADTKTWLLITAVMALTAPASVVIKTFISKWAPFTGAEYGDSLQSAGKYIGFLERLLVFVFVLAGHWEAVGFLMAAKSVFRFGDLKEAKDRKLTEYVLIGTLLSFGIALLTGVLIRYLFYL